MKTLTIWCGIFCTAFLLIGLYCLCIAEPSTYTTAKGLCYGVLGIALAPLFVALYRREIKRANSLSDEKKGFTRDEIMKFKAQREEMEELSKNGWNR